MEFASKSPESYPCHLEKNALRIPLEASTCIGVSQESRFTCQASNRRKVSPASKSPESSDFTCKSRFTDSIGGSNFASKSLGRIVSPVKPSIGGRSHQRRSLPRAQISPVKLAFTDSIGGFNFALKSLRRIVSPAMPPMEGKFHQRRSLLFSLHAKPNVLDGLTSVEVSRNFSFRPSTPR